MHRNKIIKGKLIFFIFSLFVFGNIDTPMIYNKKNQNGTSINLILPNVDKIETYNGEIAEEEINEEEFRNSIRIIK